MAVTTGGMAKTPGGLDVPKGIYPRPPAPTCTISGCETRRFAKGWCAKHFRRWETTGDPLKTKGTPHGLTPMERFMRFIEVDPVTGCWLWQGSSRDGRYAIFTPKAGRGPGSSAMAHRWIYEQLVGPIPAGLQLDHFVCDRTMCVNPEHVRPVTGRENTLRANGVAAANRAKTHCIYGHPFAGDNLHIAADGVRRCRACNRETSRRLRAKYPGRHAEAVRRSRARLKGN